MLRFRSIPASGRGRSPPWSGCFSRPSLRQVSTPRAAAILLVAGDLPERARDALDRVHDQLPHPRATVAWDGADDPVAEIRQTWRELLDGRGDEPDRLLDAPPNEWRGKGDHGQGGKGMMGGTPYGRPMAMTSEDVRDGLQLDAYTARFGPFAQMLPPGLELEITLQGDVIVEAKVRVPPFDQAPETSEPAACAARLLHLLGLPLDARRLRRGEDARSLAWRRAVPRGLGEVAPGDDVRARFSGWLGGRPGTYQAPTFPALLTGLEWHEATLVLASFAPDALRRACVAGEPE